MAWKTISASEACQHPLYGFGGWLLAIWLFSLVGSAMYLPDIFRPVDENIAQLWGGHIMLYRISSTIGFLLSLPFLVLAPMKHPLMPRVSIVAMLISYLILMPLALMIPWAKAETWVIVGATMLASAMFFGFVAYLMISKRVNVTYRHRIRA